MQKFGVLWIAMLLAVGARDGNAETPVAAILFQNVCAQCHGAKGEGNDALQSPAIAGLPEWYVRGQMGGFRAGRRGTHAKDIPGQLMRSVSLVLDAKKSADVAALVAKLPRSHPAQTIKADTTAGARLYAERCAECHRYNGSGELVFGSAPLAGLPDWYLAAQLRKFKNGQRGAASGDANGQKMILAARYIDNEDMLKSIVAYILKLQETKPEDLFGK